MKIFDLFIPVGPKDFNIVKYTLKNNLNKIKGVKDVYLFNENHNFNFKNINNIESNYFPFTFEYVREKLLKKSRAGWIYQQLVKLYFPIIQNSSNNVLVMDSDVFFLKKLNFFKGEKPIFTTSNEFHEPYFLHMNKLHPLLNRAVDKSGISHHMMFNKNKLEELVHKIENHHKKNFYDIFLDSIDHSEGASVSEYEIYFHYLYKNYKNDIELRNLHWKNTDKLNFRDLKNYQMLSLPHYAKTRPNDAISNFKNKNKRKFLISLKNQIIIWYLMIKNF